MAPKRKTPAKPAAAPAKKAKAAAAPANETGITLHYWPGRGLMEVPRLMMAIAGKFPDKGGYEDSRKSDTSDTGALLEANLGRMPTLECDKGTIGQSAAINFYVASELDLMGASTFEAAQIIAISEHLKELRTAYTSLVPYGSEPDKKALDTFFDSKAASDYSGPADRSQMKERYFKWFVGRMEGQVGDDGFAVGGKLSLADVLLFSAFADSLTEKDMVNPAPVHRREPFASLKRTQKALAAYPKVKACIASVAENKNVKTWLASRGKQLF